MPVKKLRPECLKWPFADKIILNNKSVNQNSYDPIDVLLFDSNNNENSDIIYQRTRYFLTPNGAEYIIKQNNKIEYLIKTEKDWYITTKKIYQ